MPTRIAYPIDDASSRIIDERRDKGQIGVSSLFMSAESRSEVVALFLALLELASDGKLAIRGFGDEAVLTGVSAQWAEEENDI